MTLPTAACVRAFAATVALAVLGGCATSVSTTSGPITDAQVARDTTPNEDASRRARVRMELALAYFGRGQYDVALEELAEALKFDPTYPKLYSIYGLVYAELGDDAKAESNFRRALELAPSDSEIRGNWGWYLCTHGKVRESIGEFEAALRNPLYKSPEIALINAGKCSAQMGDTAAADQYFRRALVLKPGNPVAAYNLALLSYRGGKLEDSRALMRFAMAQNPPPPEALYLGMCVERKLGDKAAEESYVAQLRNRYPNSAEARAIAGTCE